MLRATAVLDAGTWSETPLDTILLDYDARHRRRARMTGVKGTDILLDLARPAALAQGDALRLDDGSGCILIEAASEDLLRVTASSAHSLLRLTWHLGNRHLPSEIKEDAVYIRYDHVIEDMIRKLGGTTERLTRPFQPEGGAYGTGRTHGHSHD